MGDNALLQIKADVFEFDVAGGIPFGAFIIEKFLTGALSRHDDRVPPVCKPLLERAQ